MVVKLMNSPLYCFNKQMYCQVTWTTSITFVNDYNIYTLQYNENLISAQGKESSYWVTQLCAREQTGSVRPATHDITDTTAQKPKSFRGEWTLGGQFDWHLMLGKLQSEGNHCCASTHSADILGLSTGPVPGHTEGEMWPCHSQSSKYYF